MGWYVAYAGQADVLILAEFYGPDAVFRQAWKNWKFYFAWAFWICPIALDVVQSAEVLMNEEPAESPDLAMEASGHLCVPYGQRIGGAEKVVFWKTAGRARCFI